MGTSDALISEEVLGDIFDTDFRYLIDPVTGMKIVVPLEIT